MTKREDTEMLLTIPQAADAAKVTRDAIYKAIRRGTLAYTLKYGKKLVAPDDLKEWRANTKRGNPQFRRG